MPHILPPASWTKREDLAVLTAGLGAENIRWVGGAVRDTLLGVAVSDVDCATTLLPDAVMDRCKRAGIRTVPTGIDHGTVTAVFENGPVEITTLRRDVSTDGRRATVAFANEWRDDAARRDFTINALYAHPETLEISDYFDGLEDLEARRVRFIGDARERIREDHLRILRYYRFQARFGSDLDADAEDACAELAEALKGLSRERIADELFKLLSLPNPHPTVVRMLERGVLRVILPETCKPYIDALERVIKTELLTPYTVSPLRRLAALLPPSPEVAEDVAARFRLSKVQRARLIGAASRLPNDGKDIFALAYRIGTETAIDRLILQGINATELRNWKPPTFPLKGGAIVARGVAAGPDVARILQTVERRWIAEGFPGEDRINHMLSEEIGGSAFDFD